MVYVCVYIYIYRQRERERERQRDYKGAPVLLSPIPGLKSDVHLQHTRAATKRQLKQWRARVWTKTCVVIGCLARLLWHSEWITKGATIQRTAHMSHLFGPIRGSVKGDRTL